MAIYLADCRDPLATSLRREMAESNETRQNTQLGLLGLVATSRFVHKIRRNLRYEPTYRMSPKHQPSMAAAYETVKTITDSHFLGYVYHVDTARSLVLSLTEAVKKGVHSVLGRKDSRYKIVVQAAIGESKDQFVHMSSRCACSPQDDQLDYCLERNNYFCVVTVHFVYKE